MYNNSQQTIHLQPHSFKQQFISYLASFCISYFKYEDPDFINQYFSKYDTVQQILQSFVDIASKRMTETIDSESQTFKALEQLKKVNEETQAHYKQMLQCMWLQQEKQRKITKKKQHLIEQLQNQLFGLKQTLQKSEKSMLQKTLQYQHEKQALIQQFKIKLNKNTEKQEEKQQKSKQPLNQQMYSTHDQLTYSTTEKMRRTNQFRSQTNTFATSPKSYQSVFAINSPKSSSNVFPTSVNRSNMKKKSVFDFSPCKKKWIQSKIHVDELTQSQQIQSYKKQIQRLRDRICELQSLLLLRAK